MNSQNPGIPEVIAALNTLTEEIRSFRQHTDDTWKKGKASSMKLNQEYDAIREEQQKDHDKRLRQYDKNQRTYEWRWKLSWLLNGWFLLVSIMFMQWLTQQP